MSLLAGKLATSLTALIVVLVVIALCCLAKSALALTVGFKLSIKLLFKDILRVEVACTCLGVVMLVNCILLS